MDERFLRTEMLLGPQAMERLAAAHVAVFGLGGVGSWCAEALARSGVGALTLVDHDTVGLTNLNRQVEATRSTLGQPKAQAMADRIRDINPDCRLTIRAEKYEAGRREDFFDQPLDYIVDCIDLVSCKLDLIETALTRGVPIVSSLGTGNKLDPGLFRITDLSKTEGCPLARVVRKELRARGIEVLLNTSLADATDGNLQLINMADKSPAGEISTDTLVWTAGVAASPMLKKTDFPIDERGRVRVSADLRVTGDDGVLEGAWAAGDNAAVPDLSGGGVGGFCVPNAQHASRQAVVLAKNLLAARRGEPLTDYYHETIGVVAGLGLWKGVANFKGKTIGGPLAWIMHRGYHGSAIPTTERTVRVMTTWALNQIFGRDTSSIRHQRSPRLAFQEATGTAPAPHKAKL